MSALTSYGTQFTKARRSFFPTPDVAARLHSKKALERRLILPLESGQWARAFEVLNAKYARQGRNASHVQQVLNCMVKNVFPHNAYALLPVLDGVRDQVFDGSLPQSSSLWTTIAMCYCELGAAQGAMETVAQWKHRSGTMAPSPQRSTDGTSFAVPRSRTAAPHDEAHHRSSSSSSIAILPSRPRQQFVNEFQAKQVCKLLFPLLAKQGDVEAMTSVAAELFASPASFMADPWIQRCVRQARAATGDWQSALDCLGTNHTRTETTVNDDSADDDTVAPLRGLCRSGRWELALAWFYEQYRGGATASVSVERFDDPIVTEHRRAVMECLVTHAPRSSQLALVTQFFEVHGKVNCLGSDSENGFLVDRSMLTLLLQCLESGMARQRPTASSLQPPSPLGTQRSDTALPEGAPEAASPSRAALTLLDNLSFHCDNFSMDNIAGATFLKALLFEGKWERALHIAGATPLLKGLVRHKPLRDQKAPTATSAGDDIAAAFAGPSTDEDRDKQLLRSLESRSERSIAAMLYALHGRYGNEAKQFTLARFPFAFPKEVFRADGIATQLLAEYQSASTSSISEVVPPSRRTSLSPPLSKTTTRLTERSDRLMKDQILRLAWQFEHAAPQSQSKFASQDRAYAKNPQKDPRAAPLGLHDASNGWNFNGRAGLPMFGHGKHGHLLTSHPKALPAKKNPLRSWNPQLNSSLGHRDNVRKWNGKSAV
jgi:hypothetical protein